MFIKEFDYTIEHRSGLKIKHADALSRHPRCLIIDPVQWQRQWSRKRKKLNRKLELGVPYRWNWTQWNSQREWWLKWIWISRIEPNQLENTAKDLFKMDWNGGLPPLDLFYSLHNQLHLHCEIESFLIFLHHLSEINPSFTAFSILGKDQNNKLSLIASASAKQQKVISGNTESKWLNQKHRNRNRSK